jgi:ribosomal-protein-alanine N-acetyltransferase
VREFRSEDFDRLWDIEQECFAPVIAYSRLELAAYIRRRGSFTLVAEASDAAAKSTPGILGFIVAEANRRRIGHVLTIDVPPGNRRLGVGSKLLATAEERLRATPCGSVVLETAVDNTPALAFYKRHGYDIVNTIPRYYSNGLDAFMLEKELSSSAGTKRVAE